MRRVIPRTIVLFHHRASTRTSRFYDEMYRSSRLVQDVFSTDVVCRICLLRCVLSFQLGIIPVARLISFSTFYNTYITSFATSGKPKSQGKDGEVWKNREKIAKKKLGNGFVNIQQKGV